MSNHSEYGDLSEKKKKKKEKKRKLEDLEVTEMTISEVSPSKKSRKSHIHFDEDLETNEIFTPKNDSVVTKKKKKKHLILQESPVRTEGITDDIEYNDIDEEHKEDPKEIDYYSGWSKEDLQELFKRINEVIPKNDTLKYNSRVKKLNWDKIKFNSFSADDCREQWKIIEKKLRSFRVLRELLSDANTWLEKPWTHFYHSVKKNRHPDMPKRPLSSFMVFYMEKKMKYNKKYPHLDVSKLAKLVAEKFNKLPDHKKERYQSIASSMREEYNEKMQKFMEEHPEEAKLLKKPGSIKKGPAERPGPKKPLTPFKMFLQHKVSQIDGIKSQTDLADIQASCKEKWNSMSNKKKMLWIKWAHEAELKYLEELKLHASENPGFRVPNHKSVLGKREQAILASMEGKPDKPPNSAYALFSRIMLKDPELKKKFVTPKERLSEISKLWKEVPKLEKDEYAEKVKHLMESYKMEYATYLETLPEDRREQEMKTTISKGKIKDAKPGKKLKQTTISSVMKKLVPESKPKLRSLEELIKMEPVHPPDDAFILFKDEKLIKGMSEKKATKIWNSLSLVEKKKYNDKLGELKNKYIDDFRNFLMSLKPPELTSYSTYKGDLMKEAGTKDEDEAADTDDEDTDEDEDEDDDDDDDDKDADDNKNDEDDDDDEEDSDKDSDSSEEEKGDSDDS